MVLRLVSQLVLSTFIGLAIMAFAQAEWNPVKWAEADRWLALMIALAVLWVVKVGEHVSEGGQI